MPLHLIDRIAVEDAGEGDAVVCVHGLGGSSNSFTPLMPALARHRTVRIDLPGSGRSQRAEGDLSIARFVDAVGRRLHTPRGAELGLFATISAAVLLTTHSVVAILVTGDFVRSVGERFGIDRYRRTNLLDVTVCTYPFLLPYFIPTILIASTTEGADAFGMPRLSALSAGLWNVYSWTLLAVMIGAIATGWGRGPASGFGRNKA